MNRPTSSNSNEVWVDEFTLEARNWMHAMQNEELAFVFGDDKNMTKTLTVDDEDDRAGNLGHQHYFQPNLT